MLNKLSIGGLLLFLASVMGLGTRAESPPVRPLSGPSANPSTLALATPALMKTATLRFGKHFFTVEVAATPAQRQTGLMHRTTLARDRGMWFPFTPPEPVSFWMKNCLIPLDLVFVANNRVVGTFANAQPCKVQSCPVYQSPQAVDGVLEFSAGTLQRNHIRTGDIFHWQARKANTG